MFTPEEKGQRLYINVCNKLNMTRRGPKDKLQEGCLEVIRMMHDEDGMTYTEIAEAFNVTRMTIYRYLTIYPKRKDTTVKI